MTGEILIWSYSPQGRICDSDADAVSPSPFSATTSAQETSVTISRPQLER